MKIKRVLAFVLSLALTAGVLASGIVGSGDGRAEAARYGDFSYSENSDGTYEITAYFGSDKEVTIPSSINGTAVTKIGNYAFYYRQDVEILNIPNTISELYASNFMRCTGLKAINVASGGKYSSVDGILFGSNNTELIYVPAGKKLTEYTVPGNVEKIQKYAFYDCSLLETVNIGKNVTGELIYVLNYCSSLKNINIDKDNSAYSSVDGVVYNKDKTILTIFPSGRRGEFRIPSFVEYLGGTAFFGSRIDSVVIPGTVKGVYAYAFSDCGIGDIVFEGKNTFVSNNGINFCTKLTSITCPGLSRVYDKSFYNCNNLTVYCPSGSNVEEICLANNIRCMYVDGASGIDRRDGENRYETCISITNALKVESFKDKFEYIVVASGDNYPDALSGGYLCYKKNAPMILVNNAYMEQMTDYIKQISYPTTTIYVLGGEGAVSKQFEEKMSGYTIKRLAGSDRYETNLKILQEASNFNEDILVCSGGGYADCLSASAVKKPILLVPGRLLDYQKEYLDSLDRNNYYYIIGGTGAVTGYVEDGLKQYGVINRLAGIDRFETSAMVAKQFFNNPRAMLFAYSQNFPDGLSAAPLAIRTGAPILLCANNKRTLVEYGSYVASLSGIKLGYIAGGPTLISDETAFAVLSLD